MIIMCSSRWRVLKLLVSGDGIRTGVTLATLLLALAAGSDTTTSPPNAVTAQALQDGLLQYLQAQDTCTRADNRTACSARTLATLEELTRQLSAQTQSKPALSSLLLTLTSTLVTFTDTFLATNNATVSTILQNARRALLAEPIVRNNASNLMVDANFWVQTVVLPAGRDANDAVVALGSPRRKPSIEPIHHSAHLNEELFDFAVIPSESVFQSNSKIAVIVFKQNLGLRPLPYDASRIYNSRLVDVGFAPLPLAVNPSPPNFNMVSLYFKPAVLSASYKACAYWSAPRGRWFNDDCWTDADSRDVCHCNLTMMLAEDPTGTQLLIYELSDIQFEVARVDRLLNDWSDLPPKVVAQEACELMHNLSLLPGNDSALHIANRLSFLFLHDSEQLDVIATQAAGFFADLRVFVRSLLGTVGVESSYDRGALALVVLFTEEAARDPLVSILLINNYNGGVANRLASQYRGPDEFPENTEFAVTASRALLAQNIGVGYVVYPVDWLLKETQSPPVAVGFQVHNWRVLDVLLARRPAPDNHPLPPPLIELFYHPSTSNSTSRVACAVWSSPTRSWDTHVCRVDGTPRGCRCDVSLLGDEGGQVVVFEYSEVVVDRSRMETAIRGARSGAVVTSQFQIDLDSYLHNLTLVGYLSTPNMVVTTDALRTALDLQELPHDALRRVLQVLTGTWAQDRRWNRVQYSGVGDRNTSRPSRVATRDLNDILSNKAVHSATSTPFQEMQVVLIHLDASQDYPVGMKTTQARTKFFQQTLDVLDIAEEMFAIQFSVGDVDKVHYAMIQYPKSKMFLPLSEQQPAVFSYQAVDLMLIHEEVGSRSAEPVASSRLVTLTLISGEPRDAALLTGCATWTAHAWTSDSCVPVSEYACACNITTLGNDSRFLSLLVYEFTTVPNFSPKESLSAVDVVYVVLALLSLLGLGGVLLTACLFPTWREDLGHKILVHLSLALAVYQSLRLYRETHYVRAPLNRSLDAFVAFAAATHYSRLTHYAWMLAMSWLQLLRLTTVLGPTDTPRLLLKLSVLAWGVPLVPLAVLLSWRRDEHFARPHLGTHLALHLVPGALITLFNAIVLAVILARIYACCGWGRVKELGRHGISARQLAVRRLGTAVMLFFLFGLPTAFEMANDFNSHSFTLEVLFKVFDPARGLALFLFFVVLDPATRSMWRRWSIAVQDSTTTMMTSIRESSLPPSAPAGLEMRDIPTYRTSTT